MSKVKNKNSEPKKAIIEAINKAGNCNRLAVLMKRDNGTIYKWLYKKCPPGKDLMLPHSAYAMQKAIDIKGLAERLCPSIKKIKKY
jgi:hypothetical protein